MAQDSETRLWDRTLLRYNQRIMAAKDLLTLARAYNASRA